MNEMHMVFCYSSRNRLRHFSPFTFQSIPPNQLIKVIKVTTMLLNPVTSSQHPSLMYLSPSPLLSSLNLILCLASSIPTRVPSSLTGCSFSASSTCSSSSSWPPKDEVSWASVFGPLHIVSIFKALNTTSILMTLILVHSGCCHRVS